MVGACPFSRSTRLPTPDELLSEEDQVLLKRRIFALKRNSLPPIVTHNMADDANDLILNQIRRVKLFNDSHDRVKVVFHPDFLNSNNPIPTVGLDSEEFMRGCHLGMFPRGRATMSRGGIRLRSVLWCVCRVFLDEQ
jgi:glycogen(starch) synthase